MAFYAKVMAGGKLSPAVVSQFEGLLCSTAAIQIDSLSLQVTISEALPLFAVSSLYIFNTTHLPDTDLRWESLCSENTAQACRCCSIIVYSF